nr:MAG TPA: hypothetical protein [Microviridae sp.]
MSWCHLAKYLSSKVLGFCRLKIPCISLFSLSSRYTLSRVRTRAKRARAHARALQRYCSQAHKRCITYNLL